MELEALHIAGAFVVRPTLRKDDRGWFARAWCHETIRQAGIDPAIAQINLGYSLAAGTLRGLHFQRPPHAETKIVQCTRGSVFDVVVDLRPASPTFAAWHGEILTPDEATALVIPQGCAHGYQTLTDHSQILYLTSAVYSPGSAGGIAWNDPMIGIEWPLPPRELSPADSAWPVLDADHLIDFPFSS